MTAIRKRHAPPMDVNEIPISKSDITEDAVNIEQAENGDDVNSSVSIEDKIKESNKKNVTDQTGQEKANEDEQDISKSLHKYGSILVLLIGIDLTVNYLFIMLTINDLNNPNIHSSYFSGTKRQMFLGSMMRSVFSISFMLFVRVDRIYSKHPDLVPYFLLLFYYFGYSQILVCFLLDSEKSDFTYGYTYFCHLIFNATCVSCYVTIALLTWGEWKKKVNDTSGKKTKATVDGDKDMTESTLTDGGSQNEDDSYNNDDGDDDDDDDEDNPKRTLPVLVLAKKLVGWYRAELFGIVAGFALLSVTATADSLVPYYQAQIMDVLHAENYATDLLVYPLVMHAIISLAEEIISGIRNYVKTATTSRLSVHVRSALFKNLIHQDIGFFDTIRSGEVTSRLSLFSDELTWVLDGLESMLSQSVNLLSLVAVMFYMSWRLTLVLIFCNIFLLIPGYIQVRYRQTFTTDADKARIDASSICQEAIQCIRTVRTFANESDEAKRYSEKLKKESSYSLREDVHWSIMATIKKAFWIGTRALVLAYGSHLTAAGYMTGGGMVTFLLYMRNLYDIFTGLFIWCIPELIKDFAKVERVVQYLERKPAMELDGPLSPELFTGSIEFKDVSFYYPSRPDSRVLKNVSFKVNPGEVVALVGASGSGKSTCIQLLQRFYDPDEGQILLDGRPLSMYNHKYLHKQMALVSQEPVLFARSIYENIIYGEKGLTKEQVIQASKDANAHNFIEGLSKKYNTDAGEFGTQHSGGQKQRIAIARAIIRNPKILLLDEATSALDAKAEAEVQEALENNMAGRTVIVVAHRLSSVKHADRIVVLDEGEVVEQGPPDDLYKQKGLYYSLVKKQMIARQASEPGTEAKPELVA